MIVFGIHLDFEVDFAAAVLAREGLLKYCLAIASRSDFCLRFSHPRGQCCRSSDVCNSVRT